MTRLWFLFGVALVGLAACSSGGQTAQGFGGSTPKAAAQSYAEAFLHGTPSEYLALWSKTCAKPKQIPDAAWKSEQKKMGASLGTSFSDIKVTGAKVRDQTASAASATPTYTLGEAAAGNDNWIPYVKESGRWRVADCTLLPIGGHGSSKSN
jgi:hypothetical protein